VRIQTCLTGWSPILVTSAVRNINHRHCAWLIKRARKISASSYKHERRVLITALTCNARGLILDNPGQRRGSARRLAGPNISSPPWPISVAGWPPSARRDVRGIHGGNWLNSWVALGCDWARPLI